MPNKSNKPNNQNQIHNERENGKLRVSESRSKVYFDYAEREQIQDDTVGLKLRVSESRSKVYFDYAEREQIQDDTVGLKLRVSESMVGTRHAVSEKQRTSGSRLKTASQRSMLSQVG